ncbi:MAG: hypothetical protein LBP26_02410 [Clostridiales bacterium]|jgi:hypothetical protein|nr:hypothetical protein [Clostridiales bacterium]
MNKFSVFMFNETTSLYLTRDFGYETSYNLDGYVRAFLFELEVPNRSSQMPAAAAVAERFELPEWRITEHKKDLQKLYNHKTAKAVIPNFESQSRLILSRTDNQMIDITFKTSYLEYRLTANMTFTIRAGQTVIQKFLEALNQ